MNRYYVHNDHLGTPQSVTNDSGDEVWRADYRPFGEPTINADVDGDANLLVMNVRFPGQYFDAESGNHYNYFRDYNPSIGRYMQSDPIGLDGGINTYSYALQNSIRYFDPNGAMPCEQFDYDCKQSQGGFNPKAFPQRGWRGIFPGIGPEDHHNRNANQSCPKQDPCKENSCGELSCNDWFYEGRSSTHCGYKSYRGNSIGNQGYQCVYDDFGDLVDDKYCGGTYDKAPPYDTSGNPTAGGVRDHFGKDVFPFLLFGN